MPIECLNEEFDHDHFRRRFDTFDVREMGALKTACALEQLRAIADSAFDREACHA
jgi:hypothetical protein